MYQLHPNSMALLAPAEPPVASPDLAVQVSEDCKEWGELMADVWIGYTTVLETVMGRIHQLCLQDRDRSAKAAFLGIATSAKRSGIPCRAQSGPSPPPPITPCAHHMLSNQLCSVSMHKSASQAMHVTECNGCSIISGRISPMRLCLCHSC